MAFITAEIKCDGFARTVPVRLYFPTDLPDAVGNKVRGVITLLHGMGNTGCDWMMMSAAPRYAADNGYVLVAPDAGNSFYNDMRFGEPYYTTLTEELPRQLRRIFRLPDEREKNFIAGFSMGGYGALRIGLSHPERYAAIGSFSGAVHIKGVLAAVQQVPAAAGIFRAVFGPDFTLHEDEDIGALLQKVAALPAEQQPGIFTSCGKQDSDAVNGNILGQNQWLQALAAGLPLADFAYSEWDGVHEWNFWDRSLAEFIGFIGNNDYAARKRADWQS